MNKAAKERQQLLVLLDRLTPEGRSMVLEFAAFVATRHAEPEVSGEPLAIPRPARESVVAAIRRLTETFPMLDKGKLFGETSALMAKHVVQTHPASEVIDELEQVFRRHYEVYLQHHIGE